MLFPLPLALLVTQTRFLDSPLAATFPHNLQAVAKAEEHPSSKISFLCLRVKILQHLSAMRNLHLDIWLHSEALSIHQLQREDSAWGASDAGGELPVLLQNRLCPHPLPTGVSSGAVLTDTQMAALVGSLGSGEQRCCVNVATGFD